MKATKTLLAGAFVLALGACDNNNSTNTDSGSGAMAETPNVAGDTEDRSRGMAATMGDNAGSATMGEVAGTSDASGLAEPDRKALMAVMEVDRHEIEASEAALAKNVQGPVRDYAETLRDDHTRNLDTTQSLMGRSGAGSGMGSGTDSGSEMNTVAGGTAATAGGTTGGSATGGTTGGSSTTGGATGGTTGSGAMTHGAMDATAHPDLVEMKRKHDAQREQLAKLEGQAFEKAWVEAMVTGHQEALTKLDSELIPSATDSRVRDHLQTTRKAIAGHLEIAQNLQQRR